jgi:hypothetical protein
MIFTLLVLAAMTTAASAQNAEYKILAERDTTIKAEYEGFNFGTRSIHHILYEYPSKDPQGKNVTISGVVWVPKNIYDGTDPCDGVLLYNHYAHATSSATPSVAGELVANGFLASPLKPNYILVMSDYVGFGSSADRPQAFLCGDVNARNSLDGLVAARQLMSDHQIPQGKYLFNLGYSIGGTEAMFAAKLRDMEYKQKGINFTKTFAGGGPLDFEKMYSEMIKVQYSAYPAGIVMALVALNENYQLGIDYQKMFREPLASHVKEWILDKKYSATEIHNFITADSMKHFLQPEFLDLESEATQVITRKMKELSLMDDWEPDTLQNYFLLHGRHDDYVPIQSERCIIPWMKQKGFKPSLVPGKTSLQTNKLMIKLDHNMMGIVWFIQTAAAIQLWPVVYYEGEQNRYFRAIVKNLNLMSVIQILEALGIDLRKSVGGQGSGSTNLFEVLTKFTDTLAKVNLTVTDLLEMLDDSGITTADLMEAIAYFSTKPDADDDETTDSSARLMTLGDDMDSPAALLRHYEQTLAAWLMMGGINVEYNKWGWRK